MTVVAEQHTKTGKTTHRNARRGVKVLAVAGGLALIGGVAFAFWTQGGTGTGSAKTGTTTDITVNQTGSAITGLAPGVSPVGLSGDFDNPNTATVHVTTVEVTVDSVTQAPGASGDCDASDYVITGSPMSVPQDLAAGDNVGSWSGATIGFNNKAAVNQDGCKGATVTLSYTSS